MKKIVMDTKILILFQITSMMIQMEEMAFIKFIIILNKINSFYFISLKLVPNSLLLGVRWKLQQVLRHELKF